MQNTPTLSSHDLIAAKRNIDLPFKFSVMMKGQSCELEVHEILRLIPAKRLVARVSFKQKTFLLKLFLGNRQERDLNKDKQGVRAIEAQSLLTPAIHAFGNSKDGGAKFILFEYLPEPLSLQGVLDSGDTEQFISCIEQALLLIIEGYKKGILQKDIHLGNFLISRNKLYWIDGAAIISAKEGVFTSSLLWENLALFYTQLPMNQDMLVVQGFAALQDLCDSKGEIRLAEFKSLVRESRYQMLVKYQKKIFRSCTEFFSRQSKAYYLVVKRSYMQLFDDTFVVALDDYIINGEPLEVREESNSVKITLNNQPFVLKQYKATSFIHRLNKAYLYTGGWNLWRAGHCLSQLGIVASEPVLLVEKRLGLFRYQTYVLLKYTQGQELGEFLKENEDDSDLLQAVFTQLESLLFCLQRQWITLGEMTTRSFVVDKSGLLVINLELMQQHKTENTFKLAQAKVLTSLLKSGQKIILPPNKLNILFKLMVDELTENINP